ncbi:hypothetical protein EDB83DRAFT_1798022 [Lactarius deliciosus]|nr:hypothetical protein EDB83DRAFT_1798022 [Lactarius deliciosus]
MFIYVYRSSSILLVIFFSLRNTVVPQLSTVTEDLALAQTCHCWHSDILLADIVTESVPLYVRCHHHMLPILLPASYPSGFPPSTMHPLSASPRTEASLAKPPMVSAELDYVLHNHVSRRLKYPHFLPRWVRSC